VQCLSSPIEPAASVPCEDLRLGSYDFDLPPAAIAQRPAVRRDGSRLMVVGRDTGALVHSRFDAVHEFLRPGDVLILNDSKVIPARLLGRKRSGARVEALLVDRCGADRWTALVRPARRVPRNTALEFGAGLRAVALGQDSHGRTVLEFSAEGDLEDALAQAGRLPLPPYIHRANGPDAGDVERYQTIYARHPGSIAAPTAGLHFTADLLDEIQRRGVILAPVTLHVGPATFQPIRTADISQHRLDGERYHIPEATVDAVGRARAAGKRVVAVGTTATRALEAAADEKGRLRAGSDVAATVIRPGYRFRVVGGLVTNFHLPRSSLLLLVSAFLGRETVLRCYREALALGYRFYSYGDAMLLIDSLPPVAR
jgi:S-adenosylmethionine:tRNA ribosyltransferase-isomerase